LIAKLTIWPCTVDSKGTATPKKSGKFEVMLNPGGYKREYKIAYSGGGHDGGNKRPIGLSAPQPKYSSTEARDVKFDIVIDGTGVCGSGSDVSTQIAQLRTMLFDYDGSTHQPPFVYLVWGDFSFTGRLSTMAVDYTLFKPTGEPLRAKVHLEFLSYTGPAEEARLANKTSPDLTHLVEVKAGDSLPLLCYRIYKNSAYYLDVAKSNGITNFRDLKPGVKLHFPPLR
jgi:hypothetical protein